MLNETDRERIRRAFHLEHKSIRQIAKEEGCCRDTIRGAISNDPLKPYHLTRKKPAPVFGPYQLRTEAMLRENERLPRKQRYTAHRIFEVLREEGYQGCESTVRLIYTGLTPCEQPLGSRANECPGLGFCYVKPAPWSTM